jgi:hypothetical protein
VAALALALLLPGITHAAGLLNLNTSLGITGRYDSNANVQAQGGQGDQAFTFTPSVSLGLTELRWSLTGNASYGLRRYGAERNLDNESIRLGLGGQRALTERLSASGSASFSQDVTLLTPGEAATSAEVVPTADLERVPSTRKNYGWGGGLSYALSERDSLGASYSHSRVTYGFAGYTASQSNSFGLSLSRALATQRDSLSFSTSYSTNDSDVSHVKNYGASLGWSHSLSETWSLSANLGPRYTQTRQLRAVLELVFVPGADPPFEVVSRSAEDLFASWGVEGSLRGSNGGERSTFGLGYQRSLSYSAFGEARESDSLSANYSYRLMERLSLGLTAGLSLSRSAAGNETEGGYWRSYRASSSLSYSFMMHHSLQVGCSYNRDVLAGSEGTVNRYGVFLTVNLVFPRQFDI